MPIITAVRPDQRRPDRYHIELDSGAELLLAEALVAEERLGPGDTLSDADVERLRVAAAERDVFDRAARFLAARPRSRAEVRRRLLRPSPHRAVPPEEAVERTLDRLEALGYLDDAAFAAYWAEQRERFSPRSARAIQQELRQHGVDRDTAAATADPEADEARAIAAGRKRLGSLAQADYQTFTTRMGGFLQRRGFGYGVARAAIRRLWEESHGDSDGESPEDDEEGERAAGDLLDGLDGLDD
ncbi:MAG TPA: RecX family transcriptional regulator [Ktedonobacterales bacterium]|nr:RecX family transcriptional regulator [Ktedonobacterales bacterium]